MHIDVLNRDVPVHEVFFVHNSAMQWNEVLNAVSPFHPMQYAYVE